MLRRMLGDRATDIDWFSPYQGPYQQLKTGRKLSVQYTHLAVAARKGLSIIDTQLTPSNT